ELQPFPGATDAAPIPRAPAASGPKITTKTLAEWEGRIVYLNLSPDSRHVAAVLQQQDRFVVMVDGKSGGQYTEIGKGMPFFSADSSRFAYVAYRRAKAVVVADGEEQGEYDEIPVDEIYFTPDNKHL